MLADCMAGDRTFGIVFLPKGAEERSLPLGSVGCSAYVEDSTMLPDGRANVLVSGRERFALRRFVDSSAPYHIGEVDSYADEPEAPDALEEPSERVRSLFERVARAARALADDRTPPPTLPDDPALIAFRVASLIDIDNADRQTLLESRSPTDRLRRMEEVLGGAVGALERRAAAHERAKGNGHGPGLLH